MFAAEVGGFVGKTQPSNLGHEDAFASYQPNHRENEEPR